MKLVKSLLVAGALCAALPAFAQDIVVHDGYARASGMMAKAGAAFMVIDNHAATDDRLVKASSDVAARVELHTHKEDANGVMQMVEVPEGFVIPAHGSHALERGGDHVMFLGLTRALAEGDSVTVTLTFEKAGEVTVDLPVNLAQGGAMPMQGMGMGEGHNHAGHKHGQGASN